MESPPVAHGIEVEPLRGRQPFADARIEARPHDGAGHAHDETEQDHVHGDVPAVHEEGRKTGRHRDAQNDADGIIINFKPVSDGQGERVVCGGLVGEKVG